MSGGSYNYAYTTVQDMAGSLYRQGEDPLRRAFAEHLRLVSEAMRAVEWVDSCDWAEGDEVAPIRACLRVDAELEAAIAMADKALGALQSAIDEAKAQRTGT